MIGRGHMPRIAVELGRLSGIDCVRVSCGQARPTDGCHFDAKALHQFGPQPCAGIFRRLCGGTCEVGCGVYPLGTRFKLGKHAIPRIEGGPLQIDDLQTRIVPTVGGIGGCRSGDLSAQLFQQLPFEQPFNTTGLAGHGKTLIGVGMTDGDAIGKRLPPHRHDGSGGLVRPCGFPGGVRAVNQRSDLVNGLPQLELNQPSGGLTAIGQRQCSV